MICCTSREASNKFEASLRYSGILDRYPGSQLSSCDLPLEASLVPRPLFDNNFRTGDLKISAVNSNAPEASNPGPSGISGPQMGRRLEFMVASGTGLRVQNATGGLIVRVGDELYQITSFDSVGDAVASSWVPKSHRDPEKCEYENLSEAENSGYEQIFSSEKSLLLQARREEDETARFQVQHHPTYRCSSPSGVVQGGIEHSARVMWKHQEVPFTTPTSTKPTLESHKDNTHYNLVKLSEHEISGASNVILGGDGHIPPKLEALDIATVGPEPASIVVVTTGGPVSGTLLPDVASLRLGGSRHPQMAHAVILSEPSQAGDRGSAVIDAETGSCYGHVIVGGDGDVVCYMVPAPDTLTDIVRRFGRLPSLQLDRRVDARHPSTVERWKCVNPRGNTDCRTLAPLGKCTSCSAGKLYSARSRAAAHLRRKHFPGEPSPCKGGNDRWKDNVRRITVTPLYARVMQAESDSESDSDYNNYAEDTDDEPEEGSPPALPTRRMMDRQNSLETENQELRSHKEAMKHEIVTLEGDIDVLMEDREELKRELEYLRRRVWEQETTVPG